MDHMDHRGMSLVELLIVGVTVFTLVGGFGMVMAHTGQWLWLTTDARVEMMTAGQRAMDRLTEDLRRASQATLGATCSAAAGMAFQQRNANGTLGPTITYALNGTQLTRTLTGQNPQVIVGGVKTFAPTCQAGGVVRLDLTVQGTRKVPGNSQSYQLASQVWVKNP